MMLNEMIKESNRKAHQERKNLKTFEETLEEVLTEAANKDGELTPMEAARIATSVQINWEEETNEVLDSFREEVREARANAEHISIARVNWDSMVRLGEVFARMDGYKRTARENMTDDEMEVYHAKALRFIVCAEKELYEY